MPLLSGDLRPAMVEALAREGRLQDRLHHQQSARQPDRQPDRPLAHVAEVMVLFDHVIESAKIGLRKARPAHLHDDDRR